MDALVRSPERDALLESADGIAPVLRECSGPSEAERRLARPAVDALRAADLFAYRAAGTAALFETSPLQRALRDVLAAGQHIFGRDTDYVELAFARMESAAGKHAARERDPS